MKVDDPRLEREFKDFQFPEPAREKRSRWWVVALAALAAVLLVIFGIMPRIQADKDLKKETAEMAVPSVSVVQPTHPSCQRSGFRRCPYLRSHEWLSEALVRRHGRTRKGRATIG